MEIEAIILQLMAQKHLYYKSNSLSEMIFRCNCYPWHKLFEFGLSLTVCSYHVTYTFQSESTLYSSLNVYELSGCGFESTCRHLNFGLSPSKILKICFICSIEIPLNTMKNPFDFILKALFVLKTFKFLSWLFGCCCTYKYNIITFVQLPIFFPVLFYCSLVGMRVNLGASFVLILSYVSDRRELSLSEHKGPYFLLFYFHNFIF